MTYQWYLTHRMNLNPNMSGSAKDKSDQVLLSHKKRWIKVKNTKLTYKFKDFFANN